MAKKIIDVSHHQGVIDWPKAKKEIDGAILSCGYGSDTITQDDRQFARNLAECERLNIPHAVYIFSYAASMSMVESEINHILRLVKGHKLEGLYYDIELPCCAQIAASAYRRFAERVKAKGYTPGLYTYKSMYDQYGMKSIPYERLWIASYGNNDAVADPWENPNIPGTAGWQYTSTARISGIGTNVDVSLFYKDFDEKKDPAINIPTLPDGSMYRLWSYPNRHVWTSSKKEAETLVERGWKYEGLGWKSADKNGEPVFRLYHGRTKRHLLTTSEVEKKHLLAVGWKDEHVACYSETHKDKQVPVYRLSLGCAHMYTTSTHERDGLLRAGWTDEHICFYGSK
jgi:lysozyme